MWYSWIYEKWKSASTIVNFQPILLKFDTHNVWTYPMQFAKYWNDPKNVTYVAMATKIPIIKYRELLHISMCYISPVNEYIASKFIPVVYGNKWWITEWRFCKQPSDLTNDVTFSRHVTSKKSNILKQNIFFKSSWSKVKLKVNVKLRSKVKVIWKCSLLCMLTLQKRWINEKCKSAFKIVNF